ncbi:unnamed protein product [Fraxinus pennsylvanica]|uniref:Uncharacterized protein n=1 Tax=Fraxinus pennsylvanica TaxID=56036 RepID=A0AAD1YY38_9LAMI|nr:unnamed protein product [Fraxinus pennsylvanica]
MESKESGEKTKTSSFSFDLVDDKIKLIDISVEDDEFLISSPMFDSLEDLRLSGSPSIPFETMEPCRPSFAWDTAFFNCAGFLDPDELSFVNKEFDTNSTHILPESRLKAFKNVNMASKQNSQRKSSDLKRLRKIKNEKTGKGGEAAICSCKPPKVTSSGKKDILTKHRKGDSLGRSDATTSSGSSSITTEKASSHSSSLLTSTSLSSSAKASPISSASVSVSTPRIPSSLLSKNTESKKGELSISHSTSMILEYSEKKSKGLGKTSLSTRSLSALDRSSCTPPARWSSNSSSVSLSSSLRTNQKSKVSTTKFSHASQSNDAKVAPDLQINSGSYLSHSPQSQETRSSAEFSFRALEEFHCVGSESPKTVKASGLRMPSPKIGYFDESTSPSSTRITERKATQKILSETVKTKLYSLGTELSRISLGHTDSYKKPKNPYLERSRTPTSLKTAPKVRNNHVTGKGICSESRKTGDGKCLRNKVGQTCMLEKEKSIKGLMRNKRIKVSKGPNDDTCLRFKESDLIKNVTENGSQFGDLSIYFEAIDLNRDKVMPLKNKSKCLPLKYDNKIVQTRDEKDRVCDQQLDSPKTSLTSPSTVDFKARTRTPLAEKTSLCNRSKTFLSP